MINQWCRSPTTWWLLFFFFYLLIYIQLKCSIFAFYFEDCSVCVSYSFCLLYWSNEWDQTTWHRQDDRDLFDFLYVCGFFWWWCWWWCKLIWISILILSFSSSPIIDFRVLSFAHRVPNTLIGLHIAPHTLLSVMFNQWLLSLIHTIFFLSFYNLIFSSES